MMSALIRSLAADKCVFCVRQCAISYLQTPNLIHTSAWKNGLMEFFDEKKNWGENKIEVGRPWKKDELRLKGNVDLHKLWYVLLKERNMLMTMEEEYKRECELFPSPDRLEKVEESMENLVEVVQERDRTYNLLETGETGEPEKRWVYSVLGEGHWRTEKEHFVPMHESKTWIADSDKPSTNRYSWAVPFKKLYREKQHKHQYAKEALRNKNLDKIKQMYPDSEID